MGLVLYRCGATYILCTPHCEIIDRGASIRINEFHAEARNSTISQEHWDVRAWYNFRDG